VKSLEEGRAHRDVEATTRMHLQVCVISVACRKFKGNGQGGGNGEAADGAMALL
jgi:hypothetical protein